MVLRGLKAFGNGSLLRNLSSLRLEVVASLSHPAVVERGKAGRFELRGPLRARERGDQRPLIAVGPDGLVALFRL